MLPAPSPYTTRSTKVQSKIYLSAAISIVHATLKSRHISRNSSAYVGIRKYDIRRGRWKISRGNVVDLR